MGSRYSITAAPTTAAAPASTACCVTRGPAADGFDVLAGGTPPVVLGAALSLSKPAVMVTATSPVLQFVDVAMADDVVVLVFEPIT